MAPVFFLSYAREDGKDEVRRFYEDLLESVRAKIGGSSVGMGFYDEQAIELGTEWPDALTTALQGCQVFLPLYTPTYFTKPYCGKEWAVFQQRLDLYASNHPDGKRPPLVLPILWEAKQYLPAKLPEEFADLQFTSPGSSTDYVEYGMRVLVKQSWRQQARDEAIEAIAHRIKTATEAYALPPLPNVPELHDVTELFPARRAPTVLQTTGAAAGPASVVRVSGAVRLGDPAISDPDAGGPRFVQLILVAASRTEGIERRNQQYYGNDRWEWRPYRPVEERRASSIATQVMSDRDFIAEMSMTPLDDALVAQLQTAEKNNKIVVLLVDTWTLRIQRYFELMQRVDQGAYLNASVLVLWDGDNETAGSKDELDQLVHLTFYNRSQSNHARVFVSPVKSPDEFRRELGEALEAARRRMREYATLKRDVTYRPRPGF